MSSKEASAALKVLNTMMDATGSSMEDCRAMLSLCGGDPNRATEMLLAAPFEKVTGKQRKPKQQDSNRGPGGRGGGAGYGGGRGQGRGTGGRGFGHQDHHGPRDQGAGDRSRPHDGSRAGRGPGFGSGVRAGGYGATAKAHDTAPNGNNGSTPAAPEYTYDQQDASSFPPASGAPASTAPAVNGGGGWGSKSGGLSFADKLKANLAQKASAEAGKATPAPAAAPAVAAPAEPEYAAEYTADYTAEYTVDEVAPAEQYAVAGEAPEYSAEAEPEYTVAEAPPDTAQDATSLGAPQDAGATSSDQVIAAPSAAYAPGQAPAPTTWGADAGKLIMSSLKASAQPAAAEQTLSSSDNVAPAPPSTTQYGSYAAAAPGAAVPAAAPESKAPDFDAMQLSFGTFGISTGASALGDFGSGFGGAYSPAPAAQQAAAPSPTPAGESLLKAAQQQVAAPQAPQPVQQQTPAAAGVQQQPQQQPQQQQAQATQAPLQQQAQPQQHMYAQQPLQQHQDQSSMLPSNAVDPYKQAGYGAYGLQPNLGGADKQAGAAGAGAAPGSLQYQGFGAQPAGYSSFNAFGQQVPDAASQQNYMAVQQAFGGYGQDAHKDAAGANPYGASAAGTGAGNTGYGMSPGYGAQSVAPPAAASYNPGSQQQQQSKYNPYAPQQGSGADGASAAAGSTGTMATPPQGGASMGASSSSNANPMAGSNMPGMNPQQMYGNPGLPPGLNPYSYNAMGYGGYGAPNNMYSMYQNYATGYNQYPQAYPQANNNAYPSAAPGGNLYGAPNQQRGGYQGYPGGNLGSQMPGSNFNAGASTYLPTGYDDLSGAAGMGGAKDKEGPGAAGVAGLSGYGQLGGAAAAGAAGQQAGQQAQHSGQQAQAAAQGGPQGGGYGGRQGGYGSGGGRGGRGNQSYGGYNQRGGGGYGNMGGYGQGGYNMGGYGGYNQKY